MGSEMSIESLQAELRINLSKLEQSITTAENTQIHDEEQSALAAFRVVTTLAQFTTSLANRTPKDVVDAEDVELALVLSALAGQDDLPLTASQSNIAFTRLQSDIEGLIAALKIQLDHHMQATVQLSQIYSSDVLELQKKISSKQASIELQLKEAEDYVPKAIQKVNHMVAEIRSQQSQLESLGYSIEQNAQAAKEDFMEGTAAGVVGLGFLGASAAFPPLLVGALAFQAINWFKIGIGNSKNKKAKRLLEMHNNTAKAIQDEVKTIEQVAEKCKSLPDEIEKIKGLQGQAAKLVQHAQDMVKLAQDEERVNAETQNNAVGAIRAVQTSCLGVHAVDITTTRPRLVEVVGLLTLEIGPAAYSRARSLKAPQQEHVCRLAVLSLLKDIERLGACMPPSDSLRKVCGHVRLSNLRSTLNSLERRDQQISLESISLHSDSETLVGIVAVTNISYHKCVRIRFSNDNWTTQAERTAEYSQSLTITAKDGRDRFVFNVDLGNDLYQGTNRFSFCLRYEVDGLELWDNNGGKNYELAFDKCLKCPVKE
ncbi:hypothetical protein GLAREA_05998 [Glarea lozoyensis ATCC 20868]|uniref:CBM21 domain-containing protein n=1 Tax=Glarea lozoyensis (strain ATCC 20868 / MF5171) TaxID=1116229 RepID=S3DLQ1_GLAL2|nr:uncharacterized protein GLAREA_05998 [Glarea lozoyensis ATCC 20868]EPE32986.1 hypothetical protein GLAREA_05998 [Glarea lozoyensis ATCC 20868]